MSSGNRDLRGRTGEYRPAWEPTIAGKDKGYVPSARTPVFPSLDLC